MKFKKFLKNRGYCWSYENALSYIIHLLNLQFNEFKEAEKVILCAFVYFEKFEDKGIHLYKDYTEDELIDFLKVLDDKDTRKDVCRGMFWLKDGGLLMYSNKHNDWIKINIVEPFEYLERNKKENQNVI